MVWKPSAKPIMQIRTGFPRPVLLALCVLKEQEVTTEGVYWHLQASSYYFRQTLCELLAGADE